MIRIYKVLPHQIGLHFRDDKLVGIRRAGRHFIFAPFRQERIDVVSTREVILQHRLVSEIARADTEQNVLNELATLLDLTDRQRALVWVDGRFFQILGAGAHILWKADRRVRIEVIDIEQPRFEHEDLEIITRSANAADFLEVCDVARDHAGVYFHNGRYVETVDAGRYAFWKKIARTHVVQIDMKEQMLDVAGQDVMCRSRACCRGSRGVA